MIKSLDIHVLERMRVRFNRLYGPHEVEHLLERMVAVIGRYGIGLEGYSQTPLWDETTAVLITYGDMVQNGEEPPLCVLKRFADQHLGGAINTIHILDLTNTGRTAFDAFPKSIKFARNWRHDTQSGYNYFPSTHIRTSILYFAQMAGILEIRATPAIKSQKIRFTRNLFLSGS